MRAYPAVAASKLSSLDGRLLLYGIMISRRPENENIAQRHVEKNGIKRSKRSMVGMSRNSLVFCILIQNIWTSKRGQKLKVKRLLLQGTVFLAHGMQ